MSIPLLLNQDSNISNRNLNISKKISSHNENQEEKNKFNHINDIKSNVAKEIYYFKDEILKDFNHIIEKLIIKFSNNFKDINEKFSKCEKNIEDINKKINEIFEKNKTFEKYDERINDLFDYKKNSEKEMKSYSFNLNTIKREIREGFQEYDFILKKFKATQEIVGENRKFQTYPELIRFLFKNFNEISNFQNKNIVDFKGYKSKLDSTISTFKQQINVVTDAMKNFTIKSVKNSEERIKGIMSNYDDRIVEIRSEASVNSENLKKEYENLFNETIEKIKKELDKKINFDIINFTESLKNTENELEEKITKYINEFISLKRDFEIIKSNEENFCEQIKEQLSNIQNNNKKNKSNKNNNSNKYNNNKNSNNYITNPEIKESLIKDEKSKTQRNYFNPNQHFKSITNFIENANNNININNKTIKNKSKRNSIFNLSNNNLKSFNDKINEIREEKNERKKSEIINFNDRYNLEQSDNEQSLKENEKKIVSLKNGLFKKENVNNTIFKIKKIIKQNTLNKFSSDIKDNNIENKKDINKDDLTFRSDKNLFEQKDNSLPILGDIKKGDNNNISREQKLKTKREDKKTNTSFFYQGSNIKKITKRILSTNNGKIMKEQKDKHDLNLDNSTPKKKFDTVGESRINHKMSIYDVTYKPYKDYDRNKILKEERKKSSKNSDDNIIYKKIANNKKEYDYINSKGEISNVIEMPPPNDVIYKSIYQID